MTWYLQYQRAEDIIAEHQRRARALRQERLADESVAAAHAGQPSSPSVVRRALGRSILAIGRATTRFGGAVTRVGHALRGAGATPAA